MKKTVLAAASLACMFLACGKKDDEPVLARFWALAAGNEWKTAEDFSYDVKDLAAGSSTSSTESVVDSLETRDDGKLVWPVQTTTFTEEDTTVTTNYYHVTEDSVYIYAGDKNAEEPSSVEPNNLAVGVEWYGNLSIPIEIPELSGFATSFPARFKVVGTATDTVPAGVFNCLVVRIDLDNSGTWIDSAATQWRAEGVGVVKMTADFTALYTISPYTFDVAIEGVSEMTSYSF